MKYHPGQIIIFPTDHTYTKAIVLNSTDIKILNYPDHPERNGEINEGVLPYLGGVIRFYTNKLGLLLYG